ncbi:MAG: beta-galactosidase [Bacteroidota bacterium]
MKKISFLFLFFLAAIVLSAQPRNWQDNVGSSLGENIMPVGVYYYPEQWSENQWERDLERLADEGFEFTHFGEFAWAKMEPEKGKFDFEWLDKALSIAQKNDLKVIMCTPTPTPPAWLTTKHPEILSVNSDLIRQQHGSRLHVIYDHPVYLSYVRKIVTKLAERYGDHPAVVGWQIDNEPHFGPITDYSDYAEKQFPVWLKNKYNTIDSLNYAWGTAFWSQTYNYFEQIELPNDNRAPQGSNPHAMLDYQRFMADRLANAIRFQADLLRDNISENQWVTTNYAYFKFLPLTDPFRNRDDLDFASHTMYLTTGHLDDEGGPEAFRLGSGLELSFSAELAKSVNGFTGIMELQPGQINWGEINPQPKFGAVRMWVWHAFGLGDEFVCAYRFRQPLFGREQTHKGIIETDGVSLARGGKEYVQAIEEIKSLDQIKTEMPDSLKGRKTALLWSFDNINDIENHRNHADFDAWQNVYDYYAALKSMGCHTTFLQPDDAFDPEVHPFMVVPSLQIVSRELIRKWEEYVENGGHLILTTRTAKKDPNGHLWEKLNQQPIWSLIGASVPEFDHLPSERNGKVLYNGNKYDWYRWGDLIEPDEGTEVLATYADQFYEGTAAVTRHEAGEGSVTYIGVWSNDGKLENDLLREVYQSAGASVLDLPPYVFTEWRDGYYVTVNYSSDDYELPPAIEEERLVFGDKIVKPGDVAVWK